MSVTSHDIQRIHRQLQTPPNSPGAICWHDLHLFRGEIYVYPTERRRGHYYGYGCFCSLRCAKAFVLSHYDGTYDVMTMFDDMVKSVYGIPFVDAAPLPYILEALNPRFTPALTIEQYRQPYPLISLTSTREPSSVPPLALGMEELTDFSWSCPPSTLCWHDGVPIGAPVSYAVPVRYSPGTFVVLGYFCSLNCTKRFITDRLFTAPSRLALFSLMCVHIYQIDPAAVVCSPSRALCMPRLDRAAHMCPPPCEHGCIITRAPLFAYVNSATADE